MGKLWEEIYLFHPWSLKEIYSCNYNSHLNRWQSKPPLMIFSLGFERKSPMKSYSPVQLCLLHRVSAENGVTHTSFFFFSTTHNPVDTVMHSRSGLFQSTENIFKKLVGCLIPVLQLNIKEIRWYRVLLWAWSSRRRTKVWEPWVPV